MAPIAVTQAASRPIPFLKPTTSSEPTLPLISLAPLLHPDSSPAKTTTATALLDAFRTSGFLYLTEIDTLIPPLLLSAIFHQSALFFALPPAQKAACSWTTPRSNRGYTAPGREKTSTALTAEAVALQRKGEGPDMKESFEIGREGEEGCPNQWPTTTTTTPSNDNPPPQSLLAASTAPTFHPETFRHTTLHFHTLLATLHRTLMRALAFALALPSPTTYFDPFTRRADNTLRLLHYPPVAPGGFRSRIRAGAHTDYGSLTLLFQDSRGGLQVDPKGKEEWIDVPPREGAIVVNAGDLLARWSNDLIRSTRHRVVEPPRKEREGGEGEEEGYPARYSVAYFCNPDFDCWIEALPGTVGEGEGEGRRYAGVNCGEYLEGRLGATY